MHVFVKPNDISIVNPMHFKFNKYLMYAANATTTICGI